jgi:UDP-3-O-[3-hydroxymyristoyl] glucosamine N-acyltransferase
MLTEFKLLEHEGHFKDAGIGKNAVVGDGVRNDKHCWIGPASGINVN